MFLEKVVQSFNQFKVNYAVAGGLALALHGIVRSTFDLDLIITVSKNSFLNAEKALLSIGLQPRLPVGAKEVFQFRKEYIQNRNLIAWSFVNPENPIEIVDILIPFDLKMFKTKNVKLPNLSVTILSIESLIQTKKNTGRIQDKEDIKMLERLKKGGR